MATSTDVLKLDLGPDVPVTITPEARKWMTRLAKVGLLPVLDAVLAWAREQPVRAAAASVYTDYEDPEWQELLLEIQLNIEEFEPLLALSQELGAIEDRTFNDLPPEHQETLNKDFMVHLLWADDPLNG